MRNMHELFALMVCALQAQFHDFLGAVFMELELGDDRQGQYFTPYNVQSMMARLLMPGVIDTIRREGMFTLSEPTCGAGGMVIAYAECLIEAGLNPSVQMFVSCIDDIVTPSGYELASSVRSLAIELYPEAWEAVDGPDLPELAWLQADAPGCREAERQLYIESARKTFLTFGQ